MIIKADLHLHSCVSPCGDLFMSPKTIAEELSKKNIRLAALTDHNTAMNTPAFSIICRDYGIAALYGMEAQTAEEMHVLVLLTFQLVVQKQSIVLLLYKEVWLVNRHTGKTFDFEVVMLVNQSDISRK